MFATLYTALGSKVKTKISCNPKHSLLVEKDDMHFLFNLVEQRYKNLEVTAKCIDGSSLESSNIADITSFENPDYRRITSISIRARTALTERFTCDISIDRTSSTAYIDIESESDKDAFYLKQEVLNRFSGMKPWYDPLTRISITELVFALWVFIGLFHTIRRAFGLIPRSPALSQISTIETLNFIVLIAITVLAITRSLDWIQKYLFPKVFFLIGKQTKRMERIKKWRSFIFSSSIFAIITGVIGNFVSNLIIK